MGRAAALGLGVAALQTGVAIALDRALGPAALSPVGTALLFMVTAILGATVGARRWARQKAVGASGALAAVVPVVALLLYLSPHLYGGASYAPLLLAGVALASAAPFEVLWARWVTGRPGPAVARATLFVGAPVGGLGLVLSALFAEAPVVAALLAAVPAGAFAAAAGLQASAWANETRRLREHVEAIEVRAEGLVRPPPVALSARELTAIAASLEARSVEFERALERAEKERTEIAEAHHVRARFMASMSHELKSPLGTIIAFAQVLERELDAPLTAEQRESVVTVRRSAEELSRLLTDVLDLARVEAGRLELSRAWTPSVEILTEAVARARDLVEGRDVEIDATLQPGLPPVYVDRERVLQAIVALFRTPATVLSKTRVHLRARIAEGPPGPDPHLRVEIHDALGALPVEEVERIFETFQEITEPTGRRVGGLGLALSLARALVRLHGGEVWAEALAGSGTTLSVAIPLDGPSRAQR